jgi:hypothetical protein
VKRYRGIVLVTLGVASAMHLDWHFARPAHHQLSLGLAQHWLSAIPVFVFTGWYVCRYWPARVLQASAAIIAGAAVLGQVIEPLYEFLIDGASFEWAFGAPRQAAFASFTAVGIVTHAVTVLLLRRRA